MRRHRHQTRYVGLRRSLSATPFLRQPSRRAANEICCRRSASRTSCNDRGIRGWTPCSLKNTHGPWSMQRDTAPDLLNPARGGKARPIKDSSPIDVDSARVDPAHRVSRLHLFPELPLIAVWNYIAARASPLPLRKVHSRSHSAGTEQGYLSNRNR